MDKKVSYKKVNTKIRNRVNSLLKYDENALDIFNAISKGKNTYVRLNRREDSSFDVTWINLIEDTIPALDTILSNPKSVIKVEGNIVPIELSKKISSESVMHLASHSQYVKTINPDGSVVPEKILNQTAEDNIKIYENRLVATLIKRLSLFLQKRYDYIVKYSPLLDYETLYVKNETDLNESHLVIETKIKFSRHAMDRNDIDTHNYIQRIADMMRYVKAFSRSNFMKSFVKERDIRLPIIQTNILRKNPYYKKCYKLFVFIEKYNRIGINFLINEEYKDIDSEDKHDIDRMVFDNFLALKGTDSKKVIKKSGYTYAPKILRNSDDELFDFYDFRSDPEFIRVDDAFRNDTLKSIPKELKAKPKEADIKARPKDYKEKDKKIYEQKKIDDLLKRKKKEELELRKTIQAQVAAEKKKAAEEAALRKKEQEKIEEDRLRKMREKIVKDASKSK